mgnify:CR=1 FL=1
MLGVQVSNFSEEAGSVQKLPDSMDQVATSEVKLCIWILQTKLIDYSCLSKSHSSDKIQEDCLLPVQIRSLLHLGVNSSVCGNIFSLFQLSLHSIFEKGFCVWSVLSIDVWNVFKVLLDFLLEKIG